MTQLDRLRASLKYSSGANRQTIRAMILEIECGFTKPAAAEPAPAAGAVPTDDRQEEPGRSPPAAADCGVQGRGRRQQNATPPPVGSATEEPGSEGLQHFPGTAGSLAPCTIRVCALEGCANQIPADSHYRAKYCGRACSAEAQRRSSLRWKQNDRQSILGKWTGTTAASRGAAKGSEASARAARDRSRLTAVAIARGAPARARALANPQAAHEIEHKQVPLSRTPFALIWDRGIVIGADRPALPRRYENGKPALFWDDLNARADHGSPGPLPRPDDFWQSPTVSALAGAI